MLSRRQVEKRAEMVLGDAHLRQEPPISVEEITQSLGVTLRFEETDADISGALFRQGGRAVIGVNPTHSPTRRRFTIAHEVGHFVLHRDALHMDAANAYPNEMQTEERLLRDEVSSQATDPKEIEANRFAAALLMPASMLKTSLAPFKLPLKHQDLVELAGQYEVSLQAMTFRLANLGVPIDVSM